MICCFARPGMENSNHTQCALKQHVGGPCDKLLCISEAMFTVSLSEGADRSSAARMQYTSRVSRRSCSRASCSSASICLYPTRTRKTSRCDCCSLRALCRLGAARLATYGSWYGVPRIFSPLILSGSLVMHYIILKP